MDVVIGGTVLATLALPGGVAGYTQFFMVLRAIWTILAAGPLGIGPVRTKLAAFTVAARSLPI